MNQAARLVPPSVRRPDATSALIATIRTAFTCDFHLERINTRAWSSSAFRGAKHDLAFRIEGGKAVDETEAFLRALQAKNISLPGHLVAAISVRESERYPGFARISLEALTVEE